MNTIELSCHVCSRSFLKTKKEYNRRIRLNKEKFYCSLSCSGKDSLNFPTWINSEEGKRHTKEKFIGCRILNPKIKPFYLYVQKAKKHYRHMMAKHRNIDFDINKEYLSELWNKQNGRCAFSGIPLVHGGTNVNYKASLDRKDSSKGYIEGNVQFVSCALNYAKNSSDDSSVAELIFLIKQIP
jgi:hypothetical protein